MDNEKQEVAAEKKETVESEFEVTVRILVNAKNAKAALNDVEMYLASDSFPFADGGFGWWIVGGEAQPSAVPAVPTEGADRFPLGGPKFDTGRCHVCGSDDIEAERIEVEDTTAWQRVSCNDCKAERHEVYELSEAIELVRAEIGGGRVEKFPVIWSRERDGELQRGEIPAEVLAVVDQMLAEDRAPGSLNLRSGPSV